MPGASRPAFAAATASNVKRSISADGPFSRTQQLASCRSIPSRRAGRRRAPPPADVLRRTQPAADAGRCCAFARRPPAWRHPGNAEVGHVGLQRTFEGYVRRPLSLAAAGLQAPRRPLACPASYRRTNRRLPAPFSACWPAGTPASGRTARWRSGPTAAGRRRGSNSSSPSTSAPTFRSMRAASRRSPYSAQPAGGSAPAAAPADRRAG